MQPKRLMIKEVLRHLEESNLEHGRKKIMIRLPDGSELWVILDIKKKDLKLRLVKNV